MGFVVGGLGPHYAALIPMIGLGLVLVVISLTTPILKVKRGQRLDVPKVLEGPDAQT